MSNISQILNTTVEFTREWFEQELQIHFDSELDYFVHERYSFPDQNELRCKADQKFEKRSYQSTDVDIVFLAGGTCRIPFVQQWIKQQFPKAEIIIDDELEIITATGAAIHALQFLNKEVEPYIHIHNTNTND